MKATAVCYQFPHESTPFALLVVQPIEVRLIRNCDPMAKLLPLCKNSTIRTASSLRDRNGG
jgi:hypothetical protein